MSRNLVFQLPLGASRLIAVVMINVPIASVLNRRAIFNMKNIANLLFEARMLKRIPRSGYQFLGAGNESVAEHIHMMTFIAFVMAKMVPDVNLAKLLSMCLLHDLPETRTGDLNAVQKEYVRADEQKAVAKLSSVLPFGDEMVELMAEFNRRETKEAMLAYDADQIAFILDLKALADTGYSPPEKWIDHVVARIKTDIGRNITQGILSTQWDAWWLKDFTEE